MYIGTILESIFQIISMNIHINYWDISYFKNFIVFLPVCQQQEKSCKKVSNVKYWQFFTPFNANHARTRFLVFNLGINTLTLKALNCFI